MSYTFTFTWIITMTVAAGGILHIGNISGYFSRSCYCCSSSGKLFEALISDVRNQPAFQSPWVMLDILLFFLLSYVYGLNNLADPGRLRRLQDSMLS